MSVLSNTLRKNNSDSPRRAGMAMYQKAFTKAEEVCREVAAGNLEARITEIEEFGELIGFLNSINDLLDLIPPNIGRFNHLFDTAAKGSA